MDKIYIRFLQFTHKKNRMCKNLKLFKKKDIVIEYNLYLCNCSSEQKGIVGSTLSITTFDNEQDYNKSLGSYCADDRQLQ